MEKEQWYTNKELFEMIQELKKEMAELCITMKETKTLIKDYNSLRQRLQNCEIQLVEGHGKELGSKTLWGYIIGAFGIASFLCSIVFHFVK